MKKKALSFIAISVFLCMTACENDSNNPVESMAFDNVTYVKRFPKTFTLENGVEFDKEIGLRGVKVIDSLLIMKTIDESGFLSVYHLPDYKHIGRFIKRGRGNNELSSYPGRIHPFLANDGDINFLIYDFYTGDVSTMNLSRSLMKGNAVMERVDKLDKNLFGFVPLDSSAYFCREINSTVTKQTRFILKDGNREIPQKMEELNEAFSSPGKDINNIGAHYAYNREKSIMVEALLDLNHINIYSIGDDKPGKTLCLTPKLDKLNVVQNTDRRYICSTFINLSSYKDYFGALYLNDTDENVELNKAKKQRILFFDWSGEPLADIVVDRYIDAFDIDFQYKKLYTLNMNTDECHIYDIEEFLDYINSPEN